MASETRDRVTVRVEGGVADVRLNRPDKLNALDAPMFEALAAASGRLASDPSVRAVVLSGEGRAFCAGLDFGAFEAMAAGGAGSLGPLETRWEGLATNVAQQAAWGWAELPVPVIAALHGVALGGGLQIALAADLRIVAPDARLALLEVRWGLVPDMAGTHLLARLVRPDVAKELTWTSRMVSGDEAVAMGLATRKSDDPRAEALQLARELAAASPEAIRAAKALLDRSSLLAAGEQLRAEQEAVRALIGSPNQVEAVRAGLERRRPAFADPPG